MQSVHSRHPRVVQEQQRGPRDAADVTASVILMVVLGAVGEWFHHEPIHVDELLRRVADVIRDYDATRKSDLFQDWPSTD